MNRPTASQSHASVTRRQALTALASPVAASMLAKSVESADTQDFRLKYLLASCMYGYEDLANILPEVSQTGAMAIDIWPKVHGNQREQLDELGEDRFRKLLSQHEIELGCLTQYKLGPFGLQDEMQVATRLGCHTIVTGGAGPKGLRGSELKQAVAVFVEKLKPHLATAEMTGVTIAIENHGNNLIESPDSLKWLAELSPSKHLAIAFAPYHLEQDAMALAKLVKNLASKIAVFYAWQHGAGCMEKLPKEQELLQMPGRGALDFGPMLAELKNAKYTGWTEIFMHPFPRGVPILETPEKITAEINRSRGYLESLL